MFAIKLGIIGIGRKKVYEFDKYEYEYVVIIIYYNKYMSTTTSLDVNSANMLNK